MSKQLLQEYFQLCPDGICDLTVLTEDEKRHVGNGAVYLVGVLQRAETKNGNGRIYRKDTLQREVDNYQGSIRERRSLGELDHPDDSVVNLKNTSHLVSKMWWDGDNVMGKIEVLDTPSGKVLKADIVSEPSTPGAYLSPESQSRSRVNIGLYENQQNLTKSQKVNNILDDILGDD